MQCTQSCPLTSHALVVTAAVGTAAGIQVSYVATADVTLDKIMLLQ